jgi:hypothetical protein
LRIIYREHTQLQLRLIRIPASRANQQVVVLGLDDLRLQDVELEPLIAAITLRNRVLATGKPVAH